MNTSIFKRPFFMYGVYYGLASILMFVLIYTINFEFFGRFFTWMLLGLGILVAFMIMGGMAERRLQSGYLKYWEAFKALFFIGIIGYFINTLFTIIFVNLIDPDFTKNLTEVMKESTMKWMQSFNMPDEQLDETLEKMEEQMAESNTPWAYVKQFLGGAAGAALLALLCSLFVRRNPPEQMVDPQILDTEN